MGVIEDTLNRVINLNNEIILEVLRTEKVRQYIVSLYQWEQLYDQGIGSDGKSLGEYAPVTIIHKEMVNLPSDRVTLYETGGFYRSFFVNILTDVTEINANELVGDSNLIKDWGENILGLTDENLEKLHNFILPLIQESVLNIILK